METIKDGGPAFPVICATNMISHGMTLRDYFAGQALMHQFAAGYDSKQNTARAAYELADAMIAAREPK